MVIEIFKHYEIEIFFYENLNKKLEVPLQNILDRVREIQPDKKIFFLWHDYLGIIGDMPDKLYKQLEKSNIESIIDATHSLPNKDYKSQNVVYGFRKLLNQPFGSLLKVGKKNNHLMRKLPFITLLKFKLLHSFISITYKVFRWLNLNSNNQIYKRVAIFVGHLSFDKNNFFLYDDFSYSKIIAKHQMLDYVRISKKRRKNFITYHNLLPGMINIENYDISCPFGFPLIVDDNKKTRKKLWDMGVHSFILWENLHEDVSSQKNEDLKLLSGSNLILPVNQDLSSNDIHKIIDILND